MRTWEDVVNKVVELLEKQGVPLPDFDHTTDIGRTRLLLYFNKHITPETHKELVDYLYEKT